ncbi:hypothetical protein GCM10023199_28800 [Actinomycetospora chibensis]
MEVITPVITRCSLVEGGFSSASVVHVRGPDDDFLEEAPGSEASESGGGDASVSEASGAEESGSGGVSDSSDLGDDFLEVPPGPNLGAR